MPEWKWAAATCRGVSHERSGVRLQDALVAFVARPASCGYFVGIVSDGAGSATFGGQGASLVCRTISNAIRKHFESIETLPSRDSIEAWLDDTRDLISAVAERRGLASRDFAATLVCAISDGASSLVLHVGDGCVVFKDDVLGCWVTPTWPDHGEYASTTSFVTDDGGAQLNIVSYENSISAIALFSDGMERLALDFSARQPFSPFFEAMIRPVMLAKDIGRDRQLSGQLRAYLNGPAVSDRTDDDKSLILAARV